MTNSAGDSQMLGRLLYVFLCSFPYMVLVLLSFRGHWRFKKWVTFLLAFSAIFAQMMIIVIRKYYVEIPGQVEDLISSALYIAFIFLTIREHIGKLIFTVLVLTTLGDFVIMSAKNLEGLFFPEQAALAYHYTYHIFILFMLVLVLPVIYLLVFKDIAPPEKTPHGGPVKNGKTVGYPWWYLWLVPAVFYLIWMQHIYGDGRSTLEIALDPMSTVYLFLIDAGSVLIYRIIVQSAELYETNLTLLEENHANSIQRLCYESINDRLENMRKTRHDLRHHAALLKEIRQSGDLAALDELIDTYTEQNFLDQPIIFCENETVNIVLAYYSEMAYKNNISFSVKADIPEDIFIEKKDLAVLFGNLLENAADACREAEGERFIDINAIYKSTAKGTNYLSLVIKNNYGTEPIRSANGVFRSTKHPGDGIGISSVESIAKKYDGVCSFTPENGVFTVSFILYEGEISR